MFNFKSVVAAVAMAAASVGAHAADESVSSGFQFGGGSFSFLGSAFELLGTSNLNGNVDFAVVPTFSSVPESFSVFLTSGASPVHVAEASETGGPTAWNFTFSNLAAGSYKLWVSGTNDTSTTFNGGSFSVTAVPEPETYAMLLAGLGVVGAMARRRKQA